MRDLYGVEALEEQGVPCHNKSQPAKEINAKATVRSRYPGGVHRSLLDGSVHFVADTIDRRVWHDMHSRRNREGMAIVFSD